MADSVASSPPSQTRLARVLAGLFLFALIMGPGPGIYLINDFAARGGTAFGIPVLYVWAIFWCTVEAVVVTTAYFKLWKKDS